MGLTKERHQQTRVYGMYNTYSVLFRLKTRVLQTPTSQTSQVFWHCSERQFAPETLRGKARRFRTAVKDEAWCQFHPSFAALPETNVLGHWNFRWFWYLGKLRLLTKQLSYLRYLPFIILESTLLLFLFHDFLSRCPKGTRTQCMLLMPHAPDHYSKRGQHPISRNLDLRAEDWHQTGYINANRPCVVPVWQGSWSGLLWWSQRATSKASYCKHFEAWSRSSSSAIEAKNSGSTLENSAKFKDFRTLRKSQWNKAWRCMKQNITYHISYTIYIIHTGISYMHMISIYIYIHIWHAMLHIIYGW